MRTHASVMARRTYDGRDASEMACAVQHAIAGRAGGRGQADGRATAHGALPQRCNPAARLGLGRTDGLHFGASRRGRTHRQQSARPFLQTAYALPRGDGAHTYES